jgi:hypothetical protein
MSSAPAPKRKASFQYRLSNEVFSCDPLDELLLAGSDVVEFEAVTVAMANRSFDYRGG